MEGSWNRHPQVLPDWELQGQGGNFCLFCVVVVVVVISFCFNTENPIIVLVTLGFRM